MAVDLNGTSEYMSRASVTLTNTHTYMAWVRFDALGGWQNIAFMRGEDTLQMNGTKLNIWYNVSAGEDGPTTLVIDTWYHIACVRNGTAYNVYLDGVPEIDGTGDSVTINGAVGFGAWLDGELDFLNGKLAHIRVWDAVLSEAEIEAEMASAAAVRTSSLYADWPLVDDLNDDSGNNRTLTHTGTPTYASGPTLTSNPDPLSISITAASHSRPSIVIQ